MVLNGYSATKDALERSDDAFSSRPDFLSNQIMRKGRNDEGSLVLDNLTKLTKSNLTWTHRLYPA